MDAYEKSKINTKRYKKLKELLVMVYGHEAFRKGQYQLINSIINGKDAYGVMPTGAGKTACGVLPALYLNKVAVVVSPLKSLMEDQRIILEKMGLKVCCYNGDTENKFEVLDDALMGQYQFIYTTPESLATITPFLQEMAKRGNPGISMFMIDEAHCISSYGHSFRPSYRQLSILKKILPDVPILAVTATATSAISLDIIKTLGLKDTKPLVTGFDRPNLYIEINKKTKMENDIIPLVRKHEGSPMIIYCVTINDTERIAEVLRTFGYKCGLYHSNIDTESKNRIHKRFLDGNLNIVVATIAFGMGINKPNIRLVIHYGCPKTVEGYYQEIGRAGRDGLEAFCHMFYNGKDFITHQSLIAGEDLDKNYERTMFAMLESVKKFTSTKQCRKKLLLAHFEEYLDTDCMMCDNCINEDKEEEIEIVKAEQNIDKETLMLLTTMTSLPFNYGKKMYANILRGSKNAAMKEPMMKSKYYGKGTHKSIKWWEELMDHLISTGFIKKMHSARSFGMYTIVASKDATNWLKTKNRKTLGIVAMDNVC